MNEGGICAFGVKGDKILGGRIHETWIIFDWMWRECGLLGSCAGRWVRELL